MKGQPEAILLRACVRSSNVSLLQSKVVSHTYHESSLITCCLDSWRVHRLIYQYDFNTLSRLQEYGIKQRPDAKEFSTSGRQIFTFSTANFLNVRNKTFDYCVEFRYLM